MPPSHGEDIATLTWLDGNQKEVLRYMLKQGGRATIQQLKRHLKKEKGSQIAGLLANITRNARRETGYRKARVIVWVRDEKGQWVYEVVPEVLALLKRVTS